MNNKIRQLILVLGIMFAIGVVSGITVQEIFISQINQTNGEKFTEAVMPASYITNSTVNFVTGNASNLTNVLPNASIPASAANLSANNAFTSTGSTSFAGEVRSYAGASNHTRMNYDTGLDAAIFYGHNGTDRRNLRFYADDFSLESGVAGGAGITLFVEGTTGNVGIGNITPPNILTFANGSATDPIADSWLQYSTPESKIIVGEAENLTEKYRADFRNTPVYRWKRTANEPERLGVLANAKTPSEILAYHDGKNNTNSTAPNATPQGIDLGAYIGWLHEIVKGQDMQLQKQQLQIDYLYTRLNMTKP